MLVSSNHACIQSRFIMLTFGCNRVSERFTVRYSDVIQTVVTIEEQTNCVLWFQTVETITPNKRYGFGTLTERHRLSAFRIIVSNTATRDNLHHAVSTHHRKPGLVVLKYLWLSELYRYSS